MYSLSESLVLSSHERKYLTFKLIESLLPSLSSPEVCYYCYLCVCLSVSLYMYVCIYVYVCVVCHVCFYVSMCKHITFQVAAVFTPNVLRCLKNNLTEETNHLHKAAKHLVITPNWSIHKHITLFRSRVSRRPSVTALISHCVLVCCYSFSHSRESQQTSCP